MNKDELRKQFLQNRLLIPNDTLESLSFYISKNILNSELFVKKIETILLKNPEEKVKIGLYYPIKNEVDIMQIFNTLEINDYISKFEFFLPVVCKQDMYFARFNISQSNLKDSLCNLKTGKFGIKEPCGINQVANIPDIIIVPGIIFTKDKNRVGYGKGYYDRFFSKNNNIFKIGICFNNFLIKIDKNENLIFNEYDTKMDLIFTESKIY